MSRIQREHQSTLRGDLDRFPGDPPFITARKLVQVFDGGDIPTEPDKVYLTHPVTLDGDECEGCNPGLAVDAPTIPVIVLHTAAVAGDYLTAYAVGGRWVAEKFGTCQVKICAYNCDSTNSPITSASVTVKDGGGSTVATGTTDAVTGCTDWLPLPGGGTYTVQVTKTGFDSTVSATLSCGGTVYLSWEPPTPLPLTDANGTISLFKTSNTPPTWEGGYYLTLTSAVPVDIDGFGSCYWSGVGSSGPVVICYKVLCNSDGTITVTRSWFAVNKQVGTNWIYVQNTTTAAPSQTTPCPLYFGGFFCATGRIVTDHADKTSSPSSANPFAWSGTLTDNAGNKTADPVSGTVTLG